MLPVIQAYCVTLSICLFRAAFTAVAIYRKTAEAKLYTQYYFHAGKKQLKFCWYSKKIYRLHKKNSWNNFTRLCRLNLGHKVISTSLYFFYRWKGWSYVKVNSTFLNGIVYLFSMTLLPILRRIQRPITQGHSSQARYENTREILFIYFHFLRYPLWYTSIWYY